MVGEFTHKAAAAAKSSQQKVKVVNNIKDPENFLDAITIDLYSQPISKNETTQENKYSSLLDISQSKIRCDTDLLAMVG